MSGKSSAAPQNRNAARERSEARATTSLDPHLQRLGTLKNALNGLQSSSEARKKMENGLETPSRGLLGLFLGGRAAGAGILPLPSGEPILQLLGLEGALHHKAEVFQ